MDQWDEAQRWESVWLGSCANTLHEQNKQLVYAKYMGLRFEPDPITPYNLVVHVDSVVDFGGGPVSLLLKTSGLDRAVVVDPLVVPEWVQMRYLEVGIELLQIRAENFYGTGYGEAWLYNVLQHTKCPDVVVARARAAARIVRVFEWIDTSVNVGHPHRLDADMLDRWFGGEGRRAQINEGGCVGRAYYGIFDGHT